MLHSAADCGHDDVPESQQNTSSLLSQTSSSWLHELAGAWHCPSGTSALGLPGWHRAGAEQDHGLSLLVHEWARNCPCAVRSSTGVTVLTLARVGETLLLSQTQHCGHALILRRGLGWKGCMEPNIQPLLKEGSNTWLQGLCSLQRHMGHSFSPSALPIPVPFASLPVPVLSWHQAQVFW